MWTKTYNHDPNISDHDNPNYCVYHDIYIEHGKTYNWTVTCNKISDKALHNLAELIVNTY